jgi:hypothetical protein
MSRHDAYTEMPVRVVMTELAPMMRVEVMKKLLMKKK